MKICDLFERPGSPLSESRDTINLDNPNSFVGELIATSPNAGDKVILISRFDNNTFYGFCLNTPDPQQRTLGYVLKRNEIAFNGEAPSDTFLRIGGDHGQTGVIFVMPPRHGRDEHSDVNNIGSCKIASSRRMLEELATGNHPDYFLMVTGFVALSQDKLIRDLQTGQYFHCPPYEDLIFETSPANMWERSFEIVHGRKPDCSFVTPTKTLQAN